jgi:cytochrome P450
MSNLRPAIRFAAGLYRQRAGVMFAGYARRDPVARLTLRPGRANPYAIYDRLRARGPLVPTRLGGLATTSYRVCSSVLRDRRFGARPAPEDQVEEELFDLSFLGQNPPDHTRLRRLAQPAFSPRAIAGYTGRIESKVGELLDQAAAAGEFDLISAFAAALPIAVITDMLGIPDADAQAFSRYGAVIGSALDGIRSLRHAAQLQESDTALTRLFEELFELRRREPQDDVVSRIVAAEGSQIEPAEMLPMCSLLLVAGFETTVNLIGNSVLTLLSHREQWEAVCADPEGMAAKAVEETLRYEPPVQFTSRVALRPVEFEGQSLPKGTNIAVLIGGANRDPEAYDRPNTFDINRDSEVPNLAFSSGIHYCLGQPLARLEATTALRMLAERMPGLSVAGPVRQRDSFVIRGPLSLPVTVGSPRAGVAAAVPVPVPVPSAVVAEEPAIPGPQH